MAMKRALLARLEAVVRPDTVLASNTSGLSITDMASGCTHPERVITTHFWNPPHIMPLVEVVRGARTDPSLADEMRALWRRCGKVPVLVKKDRPGQLGNRMQMAMVREAVHILQEGIADAEDIDTAAKLGFGLRLPVYGVLEHQDMVGLELGYAVCDYATRDLNNEPRAPRLYQEKIARGETGARAGRGFLDWTGRDPADVRARRDRFVIDCLRRGIAG
jgi:3-hydroxybutyryl-CoA dehydrogenase